MAERLRTLHETLGVATEQLGFEALATALEDTLVLPTAQNVWLALSVLTGRMPKVSEVLETLRAIRLDGPLPVLFQVLEESGQIDASGWVDVEVVSGQVLVDVHHTVRDLFATGIQRVARETARRWCRDHEVVLVGWTDGYEAFRRLSPAQVETLLRTETPTDTDSNGRELSSPATTEAAETALIPWNCTHLVPELPAEVDRALRYQAFFRFSCSDAGLIGFDCVPFTAAETSADGMSIGFSLHMAAASHVRRIATISEAAAGEYRGWRTMLTGIGNSGPEIKAVPLPIHAEVPSEDALCEARQLLGVGSLPVVLTVGSHEPRKNHLAVLHAAETLWREGMLFTLAFAGGNSWNSETFSSEVARLQGANRPLQTILALPDDLLWAAYRLAYCTVFPSLHEGFGLPVAESLASGTPVITSNFGSMLEIAAGGGALLVDPRDDKALTDALRRLLLDHALRDGLASEATKVPTRTWDDYATDTWTYLTVGESSDAT